MILPTPYYLISEKKLLRNLRVIERIRRKSEARAVLALKCFSTWSVFPLMRKYLDGTTASSPFEAQLGHEKFGKEVHVYCVAFSGRDLEEIRPFADTVIFNSIRQLKTFAGGVRAPRIGLRVNPGFSYSHFDLADPCRKYSRLGVSRIKDLDEIRGLVNGFMFHFNCENDNFRNFSESLERIARLYGTYLEDLDWVSLGGGLFFTRAGYPVEEFAGCLKAFRNRFGLRIYLEPGESTVTDSTELVVTILDIVRKDGRDIAIVDASTEAHMLDLLIYHEEAEVAEAQAGSCAYTIAGRSCLAGDVFGAARFRKPLRIGQRLHLCDAAGYTMVKKNWFNGLQMPAIVVERLNGAVDIVRRFSYGDFKNSLS